jgi:hypothetical protein
MTTVTDDDLIATLDRLTGRLTRIRSHACTDAVIDAEAAAGRGHVTAASQL